MRRRLAEEGASFFELLSDVRMSHALTLLQVTDLPVIQIAYEVGYKSQSRFALRFRRRFGFAPLAVRQGPREIDRIGALIDRKRNAPIAHCASFEPRPPQDSLRRQDFMLK